METLNLVELGEISEETQGGGPNFSLSDTLFNHTNTGPGG